MSDIKIKYGVGEIHFSERDEQWLAYIDTIQIARRSKLREVKKAIDQHGNEEKKLERHTAILKRYNVPFETVTVTSYPENSWRGRQAWVTRVEGAKKRREQVVLSDLYEDIPKNHVIISELKDIAAQIDALREKQDKLETKLEKYKQREIK
jgi:hypothetical protein